MLSRSRSHVFSKNGSMLKSKLSMFGASGLDEMLGSCERLARDEGNSISVLVGGGCGIWCRKDVSKCELCT